MTIISKAPCRLSLVGGGTDVDPFAAEFGGLVLNFAISIYHQVELIPHQFPEIKLKALNRVKTTTLLPRFDYGQQPEFDLIYSVINYFRPEIKTGFRLKIIGPEINPVGLGRSSSVGVAIIGAFNFWLNAGLSRRQIGLLSSWLEVNELGWPNGKQDGLAAALGGINLLKIGPKDEVKIKPIRLSSLLLKELIDNLIVFNLGGEHHSSQQQQQLIKGMRQPEKLAALQAIKTTVLPAVSALQSGNWALLGKIIDKSWQEKKKSNPLVSGNEIDRFYNLGLKSGAYGGKLAGSGGAGYLFFLCPPQKQLNIVQNLSRFGIKQVKFNLDFKGVQVKYVD